MLFFQSEARVSEVFIKKSDETLEQLSHRATDMIEVKGGQKEFEILKSVTFPKETHYEKLEATTYTESASLFDVVRVLKGNGSNKKIAKVWQKPDYDQGSYQLLHEKGISESSIVIRYKASFPIADSGARILFLIPSDLYPGVFELLGEEGLGAQKRIEKSLKEPPKPNSTNEPIRPIN